MDPLSATASAIALIQAAVAIGKGIKAIRSFGRAPTELCSLLNELSTLQALSSRFETDISRLDDGSTLPSEKRHAALVELRIIHDELSTTIARLESLVQRFVDNSRRVDQHGQHRIPRLRWQLEKESIVQLSKTAQRTREYLTAFMTSIQLSRSFEHTALILRVERSFEISAQHLSRTMQESSETMNETHQAVLNLQRRIEALEGGCISHDEMREVHEDNSATRFNPILCFETSLARKCHSRCRCQCHRPISRGSPNYLQPAIGAFFLSYKTLSVFGNGSCDDSACQRRQSPRLEFHYYLPRWLFSRAVHFSLSWDSLTGMGATFHLKMPRVIDPKDIIWEAIRCKDLNRVSERLSLSINTPADVSPAGMSLLLYAVKRGDFSIIKHLMQLGCDVSVRDIRGSSPATVARSRLLAACTITLNEKAIYLYKKLISLAQESLDPEHSSLVHDAVLNISDTPLEEAMAIEPQSTDSLDSLGYAPLHWAVRRHNISAITSLLQQGHANPNIPDRYGRTPLHLAAKRGFLPATQQLLDHGADPNAQDIKGKTPLHLAVCSSEPSSLEVVHHLLAIGAQPDTPDRINYFTPLNNLIYECLARNPSNCSVKIAALLSAGADINRPDKSGCPPLLNAAMIGWDNALLELCVGKGARLEVVDRYGRGLLHYVAAYGELTQIEYLRGLKLRPAPDIANEAGDDTAVQERDNNCLQTRSVDVYGHTPLSLMRWRAKADARKLRSNTSGADEEDLDAFWGLLKEIEANGCSPGVAFSNQDGGEARRTGSGIGTRGRGGYADFGDRPGDNDDDDLYADAQEYLNEDGGVR